MVRATAAVLRHYGWSVNSIIRHKDWSDWKNDPAGVDWDWFRSEVAERLGQTAPGGGGTQPGDGGTPADPDAFPGAGAFGPGADGPQVTRLGQMLVARGGGRFYSVGPGPQWGDADRHATAAFQAAQGWTGSDADGIPGPTTWDYLVHGTGNNIPAARPTVSVSAVADAARRDPGAPQGSASHPDDVRPVEQALRHLGWMDGDYAGDGSFGSVTVAAYAAFQRALGYRGSDADGIPGRSSLAILGDRSGLFDVSN
jgi:peptidoglycan hydrolase-like protein with peptidoglycan-binding domain